MKELIKELRILGAACEIAQYEDVVCSTLEAVGLHEEIETNYTQSEYIQAAAKHQGRRWEKVNDELKTFISKLKVEE